MSDGWQHKDDVPDLDGYKVRYGHHFKIGDIVRLKTGREPMMVIDIKKDVILCSYMIPEVMREIIILTGNKKPGERKAIDISKMCTTSYERSYRRANDYVYANEGSQQMYTLFGVKETKFWREFDGDNSFAPYTWHNHINIIQWFKDRYIDLILEFKRMNQHIVTFNDDKDFNQEGETQMDKAGTLYQVIGKEQYGTYLATNSEGKYVLEMKDSSNALAAFDVKEIEEVVPWTFEVNYKKNSNTTTHYTGVKDCVKVGDVLMRNCGSIGFVTKTNTKNKGGHVFKGSILTGVVPFNSDEVKNEG